MRDWVAITLVGVLAIIILVAVVVIVLPSTKGAESTPAQTISFWHDDQRHVGCWIYASGYRGGLSCLPDGQYTP